VLRKASALRAVSPHNETGLEISTHFVLSGRDLSLVQEIVRQSPELVSVKFVQVFAISAAVATSHAPLWFSISTSPIFSSRRQPDCRVFITGRFAPVDLGHCSIHEAICQRLTERGVRVTNLVLRPDDPMVGRFTFLGEYVLSKLYNEYLGNGLALELFVSQQASDAFLLDEIAKRKTVIAHYLYLIAARMAGLSDGLRPGEVIRTPSIESQSYAMRLSADPMNSPVSHFSSFHFFDEIRESASRRLSLDASNSLGNLPRATRPRAMSVGAQPEVDLELPPDCTYHSEGHRRESRHISHQARGFIDSMAPLTGQCDQNSDLKMYVFVAKMNVVPLSETGVGRLASRYAELMKAVRFEQRPNGNDLSFAIGLLNRLRPLKIGAGCLILLEFGRHLNDWADRVLERSARKKKKNVVYRRGLLSCLILADNDKFYETYIWLEKMILGFPEFGEILATKFAPWLAFMRRAFWGVLAELDPEFVEKSSAVTSYLL
jgi:hypothetical protein